jgi:hypothetical protein
MCRTRLRRVDSLDAQALVIELLEDEIPLPELWRHDRSGALSLAFGETGTTFTWEPDQVADMAQSWRDSGSEVPEPARMFLDLHQRLGSLIAEAGRAPADFTIHDFARREVRAIWEDDRFVLIVDGVPQERSA